MRFEPAIDKKALLRTLRQACGLAVDRLRFVATEWQAYCYVVECIGGERYFLKLHDDSGQTPFAASCRDFYVPLMYELHAKDILPHVPHPLMTQDEQLVIDSGEYSLLLSNYIDG